MPLSKADDDKKGERERVRHSGERNMRSVVRRGDKKQRKEKGRGDKKQRKEREGEEKQQKQESCRNILKERRGKKIRM